MEQSKLPKANSPDSNGDALLASIRDILLTSERSRLEELEQENEALHGRVVELEESLTWLYKNHSQTQEEFQSNLQRLKDALQEESERVIPRVTEAIDDILEQQNSSIPDEMAEALGPILADSTRVQIRVGRENMVDALYPIIGETVQTAVIEFTREFQRNIDARLKGFRQRSILSNAKSRLQGVSSSELVMRGALPFAIEEVFIIQHETGMILAHSGRSKTEDSDLISSMLTAIQDFVSDSFGDVNPDTGLAEVQFGRDRRIMVQSGPVGHLAVVIAGIEPEGFRAALRKFISELHVQHISIQRSFSGDEETIKEIPPTLDRFLINLEAQQAEIEMPAPMSRGQKLTFSIVGILTLLLLLTSCFYLVFTIRLLPSAFPGLFGVPTEPVVVVVLPTSTPTSVPTNTLTPTPSPSPTASPLPTATSVPTTDTATPLPTATAMIIIIPTATDEPFRSVTKNPVWLFERPDYEAVRVGTVPGETAVSITALNELWAEIEWQSNNGIVRGWVAVQWLNISGTLPKELATPQS